MISETSFHILLLGQLEHTFHVFEAAEQWKKVQHPSHSLPAPPPLLQHSTISRAAPVEPSFFQHVPQGSVEYL